MEEESKFEQQTLVPDKEGEVFIEGKEIEENGEKESNYPPLRTEKGTHKFEKKEENLVSFKKGVEIEAFSRGLRRYVPHVLQNNINAYVVDTYKDEHQTKKRCYFFEENLDEQTNHAHLISRGYEERLDGHFPFFYARKNDQRKAKKTNRLIK